MCLNHFGSYNCDFLFGWFETIVGYFYAAMFNWIGWSCSNQQLLRSLYIIGKIKDTIPRRKLPLATKGLLIRLAVTMAAH